MNTTEYNILNNNSTGLHIVKTGTKKNDNNNNNNNNNETTYRTYKIRWFILFNFVLIYFFNSYQWLQYTIIQNIIMKYYNISDTLVNFTSLVYLIFYLPLAIPASYLINKKGLRFSLVTAATLNCVGSIIKVPSADPNRFYLGLIGQSVLSLAQVFIISLPSKLAGIWFSSNEMSTACFIGLLGFQLGSATGLFITPYLIQKHDNLEDIGKELSEMFWIIALISILILILTSACFKREPTTPPSASQSLKSYDENMWLSFKRLFTNGSFLVLLCAYGINLGVFNTISTLLNPILVPKFPENGEQFAGIIGFVLILSGVSLIGFGMFLDKTKKYKQCTVFLYIMSLVGMVLFLTSLCLELKTLVYVAASILGIFMSGYVGAGLEMGVELTYPELENNSSSLLMSCAYMSSAIITIICANLLEVCGGIWTIVFVSGLIILGIILTIFCIPNILRRQKALQLNQQSEKLLIDSKPIIICSANKKQNIV